MGETYDVEGRYLWKGKRRWEHIATKPSLIDAKIKRLRLMRDEPGVQYRIRKRSSHV